MRSERILHDGDPSVPIVGVYCWRPPSMSTLATIPNRLGGRQWALLGEVAGVKFCQGLAREEFPYGLALEDFPHGLTRETFPYGFNRNDFPHNLTSDFIHGVTSDEVY
jgi:hypothetical protein